MSSLPEFANGQPLAGSQPASTDGGENSAGNNQPQSSSNTSSGLNPVPSENNQGNDGQNQGNVQQNQGNDGPMDTEETGSAGNDQPPSSSNTSSRVNNVPSDNNQGNNGQNEDNAQQNQGHSGQNQGFNLQPKTLLGKRSLESPQSQKSQGGNTGPFTPFGDHRIAKKPKFGHQECPIEDEELEAELPNQTTPAHMTTLGKVKMHGITHYVNQYKQNGRRIFRIQSIKDPSVSDASLMQFNHKDYQGKYAQKPWAEVRYVEGVCTFGTEDNHTDFLSQLDPENLDAFVTPNVVLIRIKWSNDNEVAYVNRDWWRHHYQPLDPGSKRRFATRLKEEHPDQDFDARAIRNAFKDSRLYRWAFKYEQLYYKGTNGDAPFSPEKRAKSLSPTMEQEIRNYREGTMPPSKKQSSSNIYQSIERTPAPESDYGDDVQSLHDSQSYQRSSRRPAATPGAPHLVDQNGSPRPQSGRMRNRRSQRSIFNQPNRVAVAAY
ncbi:hypothetical protein FNYG_15505 [Fusarium nygamai]|uniref:Uncharacterized protein n=1 Tax=Gibberella nygamai TaxID=42673 RepID=A0A2K0UCA4_GIBNY|nr:hypothetical protein FNYG_15505 [Fusarium nygamai]